MINLKTALYGFCLKAVEERRKIIEEALSNAQASANDETKSSAGDKYETGRAMMHLETEKLLTQLGEVSKMEMALNQIDTNKKNEAIAIGSLVFTTSANYFISISLGQIELQNAIFFAISPASPVGRLMLGKTENQSFEFGGKKIKIEKVV
ncbi:MAG: 3-oxoacyl-ACP synthase [Cytophagales bacterium CG12_big_fil_rev_8_21_14_0_65_40_12]|nr:MAG: 3-oxoacyl-ACP synthase [Cytophagales bacterium CG12_big_fil_rev_8_21_14_0_65_40_12]PIW05670.1 MAG: 3-oxoacyl-ACP synthase [Cytophagales bacterium CG17_big_fil_post_rev_8_21_14_2_50_40_13]